MLRIVDGPIDVAAVTAAVRHPGAGAVLVFEGVGRDHHEGKAVKALHYEAWPEQAEKELARIAAEVEARWPGTRLAVVHRTGPVAIGEPSVVVAVATTHRAEAYAASRYAIDTLKERLPVWKKELYEEGSAWIANRS